MYVCASVDLICLIADNVICPFGVYLLILIGTTTFIHEPRPAGCCANAVCLSASHIPYILTNSVESCLSGIYVYMRSPVVSYVCFYDIYFWISALRCVHPPDKSQSHLQHSPLPIIISDVDTRQLSTSINDSAAKCGPYHRDVVATPSSAFYTTVMTSTTQSSISHQLFTRKSP